MKWPVKLYRRKGEEDMVSRDKVYVRVCMVYVIVRGGLCLLFGLFPPLPSVMKVHVCS